LKQYSFGSKIAKNQFFINSLWVFVNGEDVNLHHFLLSL